MGVFAVKETPIVFRELWGSGENTLNKDKFFAERCTRGEIHIPNAELLLQVYIEWLV